MTENPHYLLPKLNLYTEIVSSNERLLSLYQAERQTFKHVGVD